MVLDACVNFDNVALNITLNTVDFENLVRISQSNVYNELGFTALDLNTGITDKSGDKNV